MSVFSTKLNPRQSQSLEEKCVWFLLGSEGKSPAFIQLDWKMNGGLSRALQQGSVSSRTVVPTLKRLKSEYVMLCRKWDWVSFVETCRGMKLDSAAVLCRDEQIAEQLFDQWKKHQKEAPEMNVRFYVEERDFT